MEETGEPRENPRSIGKNNTSNKLNSHMVSAELKPVTQTFGTTVVKDDVLAAYATHATHKDSIHTLLGSSGFHRTAIPADPSGIQVFCTPVSRSHSRHV
jgi:hypothetical protein